jgi:hypothetical protein
MLKIPNTQINLEQNLPSPPEFLHVLSIDRNTNITIAEGGFCLHVIVTASIYSMNPPLQMVDNRLFLI